jgi:uncharacterized membrane protein
MQVRGRDAHARSIVKAVSWRMTGSFDTFVISWILIGSTKIAGSIAGTELLTKILLYYFHERVWALIPWGHGAKPYRPTEQSQITEPKPIRSD